jgi:hypothetical protein
MLEPAYRDVKLLIYKENTYKGQEEDEWQVLGIIGYKDIDNEI